MHDTPDSLLAAHSQAITEVLAVEQQWTAAHLAGDFATIATLMAPDYVRIQPGGSVAGRDEVLATYQPHHRHWAHAAGDQYDVRIYGDLQGIATAVVVGRWTARGINHGVAFDYAARFLSVYVKRDGRWQMVAEQSTDIR
jgi:uncharacterized protein (TIGR02246 family)